MKNLFGNHSTTSEHSDKKRRSIGWTAFAVALFRAYETKRLDRDPIIQDNIATGLFNLRKGSVPLRARLLFFIGFYVLMFFKRPSFIYYLVYPLLKIFKPVRRIVDMVALRTKFIDQHIEKFIPACRQLVIVGAGLDARSLRLAVLRLPNIRTYEVDFADMLKEKRRLFTKIGFNYSENSSIQDSISNSGIIIPVATDLTQSVTRWQLDLKAAGFEPSKPCIWLLEGLTGYLTSCELTQLLAGISELSPQNSKIIATWLGTKRNVSKDFLNSGKLSTHLFFTDTPDDMLLPFGWEREQQLSLGELAERYAIKENIDVNDDTYWITCHKKK